MKADPLNTMQWIPAQGNRNRNKTPEQKAAELDLTRRNLVVWLTSRRNRLGMTEQDIRESPENVLKKQQLLAQENKVVDMTKLHDAQRELINAYMQTTVSDDTMNYTR